MRLPKKNYDDGQGQREREDIRVWMDPINQLLYLLSCRKVGIVRKLENKTFKISTTNSAVITDSILRDIQIRLCLLDSPTYFLSIFNKVGLYTIEINHNISNC